MRPDPGGLLGQLLVLGVLWWIIAEGEPGAWLLGVPTIVLATAALAATGSLSVPRLRLAALPGFVVYFAWQSLRGGVDVARRAFTPGLDMQPAILELGWRLPPGAARTLAVIVLNLLPGTLAVRDQGQQLSLHVIDAGGPAAADLEQLERRVSALLGLHLADPGAQR